MKYSQIESMLIERGVKPTAMRLLVLDKLHKQKYAISHNDLILLFEKADTTTLFRTLKTFLDHQLIHAIEDGTGMVKYALCQKGCTCSPKDSHIHFHCNTCEKTYCLTNSVIPELNLPFNFKLKEASLVLKGICDTCHK